MENNRLVLTIDGKDIEYRILINVVDMEGKNYVVYTNDEVTEKGDILTYAAEYIENKETGNIKLISIKNDKTWEFIREILNSVQGEEEEK